MHNKNCSMKYLLLVGLLIACEFAFSQAIDNTLKNDSSNIYNKSIKELLRLRHNEGKNKDTIFIDQNSRIVDSLLNRIENTRIVKLSEDNIQVFVKHKKPLLLFRVSPIAFGNDGFWVSITPFSMGFSRKQKKYVALNGGTYRIFYKFNGAVFVFDRIEHSEW